MDARNTTSETGRKGRSVTAVTPRMFPVSEIARRLSVSRHTVYAWIDRGALTSYSFAGVVRVSQTDLDAFLECSKIEAVPLAHRNAA